MAGVGLAGAGRWEVSGRQEGETVTNVDEVMRRGIRAHFAEAACSVFCVFQRFSTLKQKRQERGGDSCKREKQDASVVFYVVS